METAQHTRQKVVVVALVVLVAALLTFSNTLHNVVQHLLDSTSVLIAEHPLLGKVVFVIWSAASAMFAFVSSAIIVPVAVYAWGPGTTLLLLWLSWLLGGVTTYVLGRTLGRSIATWLVSRERVEYYAERISKSAGFLTVLLFQLGMPSEVPGYVLGAVRYRFPIYFAALAIAELPFALGAVYLGEGFLQRNWLLLAGVAVAALALSALAFRQLHRRIGPPPAPSLR